MDNKEQITTRAYKIKAIVIGTLAVMIYIASQYVMFCNLPILEPTGERVETDFLKWAINRNIGCIVLGIILMLIPYEWLADKFIKSHEKKLKNSAAYRICTIIGAGIVLPVIAILLAIAIPTGYPDTAIICCAGSVIALGIFVFPLFDNKINYQGYLALVGFISMALVYVLTLYQKPEYTNDFYRFQMPEDRLQYLFILFIFLSIIIAAFGQCIAKKEGSLKYNILVFIWIAIIAIFCWAIVFNLLGMADEDGFTLKIHSLYMQYMDSSMSAFHFSSFMILLGMLAVNIIFSAVAVKCTSKYSVGRTDILRWVSPMTRMRRGMDSKCFIILTKGDKTMIHYMELKKDPFEDIRSGEKIYELRLFDVKRKQIKVDDHIVFKKLEDQNERMEVIVKGLYHYKSFRDMFEEIPLEKCGFANISKDLAVEQMYTYYSVEDEQKNGVLAIEMERTDEFR